MAFAMQLPPLEDSVQQLRSSAKPRHAVGIVAGRSVMLGTNLRAASPSTFVFRPGFHWLLGLAVAGLTLAPQQKRRLQRANRLRCRVTGLDGEFAPTSPLRPSQGLTLAAVPVMHTLPMPAPVAASATLAEIPKELCAPCKFRQLAPVVPAVACHFSQPAVPIIMPATHGLSRVQPALRVNAVRCARRRLRMHDRTEGVAPLGRTRAIRRAVGARLLPTCDAPNMQQAAFDPSRLRTQLQVGLQVMGHHARSGWALRSPGYSCSDWSAGPLGASLKLSRCDQNHK